MWPVPRVSRTWRRGSSDRYSPRHARRDHSIERVVAGDDAASAPATSAPSPGNRAPAASATRACRQRGTSGAASTRAPCVTAEPQPRAPRRHGRPHLGPEPRRRASATKSGAAAADAPGTAAAAPRLPARRRRRHQHQRADPFGPGRRVAQRDEAAVRHAAERRPRQRRSARTPHRAVGRSCRTRASGSRLTSGPGVAAERVRNQPGRSAAARAAPAPAIPSGPGCRGSR